MSKEKALIKKDLRKAAWRWLIGISTFNYETQLAPSTLFSAYPCSRKTYPDDEDLKRSCLNYMRYYSIMPWIPSFVTDAALDIEGEGGISSLDAVNNLKVGLMGPLAGVGDTIGWVMISAIFGSIAADMGTEGNPLEIFLRAAFTSMFLVVRILQYEWGYGIGINVITKSGRQITVFTEACSVLGLAVVGSLVATVIKFSTGLQFKNGDVVMKVQEPIDGVMPALLPAVVVGIIYYFMKAKKVKMTWMVLFIIVASMVGAVTGIFTAQKEGTDIEGCDPCR